ncbi:MAG: Crp/Fnr family transcriptional regulator [Clostridia bacterium]|nr:Crp/Fnr family transcriptional regulator [Clostridia bacterium]
MDKQNIFDQISSESMDMILPCFKPYWKNYSEGETILTYDSSAPQRVEVLEKGSAKLQILNEEGDIFLIERIREGDVFGEPFALPLDCFAYIVTAETDCRVLFLDYDHIIKPCENLCEHHSQIISNLFIMAAQKSQGLSLHISFLHQNTIRQKILAYLSYAASITPKSSSGFFTIPMSLVDLAEYLNVDRSAMMREIKALKNEGIIDSNRREFKLY